MLNEIPADWRPVAIVPEDWLLFIWRAWHRLSLDRGWDGGLMAAAQPRRIAWSDIERWAGAHDLSADDAELLHICAVEMDTEYLKFIQRPKPDA